jgi:hypothetical protein
VWWRRYVAFGRANPLPTTLVLFCSALFTSTVTPHQLYKSCVIHRDSGYLQQINLTACGQSNLRPTFHHATILRCLRAASISLLQRWPAVPRPAKQLHIQPSLDKTDPCCCCCYLPKSGSSSQCRRNLQDPKSTLSYVPTATNLVQMSDPELTFVSIKSIHKICFCLFVQNSNTTYLAKHHDILQKTTFEPYPS